MTAVLAQGLIETPLGPMRAGFRSTALAFLEFEETLSGRADRLGIQTETTLEDLHPLLPELRRQLEAYFAGHLRTFDLPIHLDGTEFQKTVWRGLLDIPYGATRSYIELSESIGNTLAVRAVGQANGSNRIAIVVPCHRVVRNDGNLGGYGGGLWRKKKLLELESGQGVIL